jgi:hypothetical protein
MANDPLRRAFWKEVKGLWPLAKGSVTEVTKPCIRPGCPACQRGDKHRAVIFTFHQEGKQRCRYVPQALVPRLRQAVENGRQLEQRLATLGEALILAHRRTRRAPPP